MPFTVMSWNVDGTFPPAGSPDAINAKLDWLQSLPALPDILLLQEVNPNRDDLWRNSLQTEVGYTGSIDTLELAQELDTSNGHITAVRNDWPITRTGFRQTGTDTEQLALDSLNMQFPEKILAAEIAHPAMTLDVWNVRAVPGNSWGEEKLNILEYVYDQLDRAGGSAQLLAGDLNTPEKELPDGQAVPFGYDKDPDIRTRWVTAELNILKGLGHLDMIDVFRTEHGYKNVETLEYSWDRTKRFDHMFASQELHPSNCRYLADGYEYSDHAPIIATFDP